MPKLKAEVIYSRGSVTSEHYGVLKIETGRKSLGRDYIILKLTCQAYEEDKVAALSDLQRIADIINNGSV